MKMKLALVVVAALSVSAYGKEILTKSDVSAFNLWSKAVREDYKLYRSLEDELLLNPKKVDPSQERSSLTRNLHQDLAPEPPVSTRLIEAGNRSTKLTTAGLQFADLAQSRQQLNG